VLSAQKLNPRQTYLDRFTKWPGKGKAVEHAQQNVNVTASWTVSAGPIEVFIYLIRLHILMQKRPES
jgi:hypothetical protein